MNYEKKYKEALERVSPKFRIGDRIKHKLVYAQHSK